jgi:hypothetical protein
MTISISNPWMMNDNAIIIDLDPDVKKLKPSQT